MLPKKEMVEMLKKAQLPFPIFCLRNANFFWKSIKPLPEDICSHNFFFLKKRSQCSYLLQVFWFHRSNMFDIRFLEEKEHFFRTKRGESLAIRFYLGGIHVTCANLCSLWFITCSYF